MTQDQTAALRERVERERHAHTDDDVLAHSQALKDRFPHLQRAPSSLRLQRDLRSYFKNLQGARVLDLGCGRGELSLELLDHGAAVVGVDISTTYIDESRARAQQGNHGKERAEFRVMDAHALELDSASFDLVTGRGILHHLDLDVCLAEIHRVLRPGGRALFVEPLAGNPLLRLFRRLTPAARTSDEKPLSGRDLQRIAKTWRVDSTFYGLVNTPVAVITSILLRPYPNNILLRVADKLELILNRFRPIRPFNQYVLLNLVRP